MLKNLTFLIVDQDMSSKARLRECIRHAVQKPKFELVKSEREALQLIENLDDPCDMILLSSGSGQEAVLDFFSKAQELKPDSLPPIVVILKGDQVDSSFVTELYLRGVNGFLKEPFSTVKLNELLEVIQEKSQVETSEEDRSKAVAGFLIGDAMRYIDQISRKRAAGEIENKVTYQKLKQLSEKIGVVADKISDLFEDIMVRRFSAAPIPKELQSKKKTSISCVERDLPHPAFVVREMIEQRNMSKEKFVEMLNLDSEEVEQFLILQGEVDDSLASELSRVLGREPKYWLDLQSRYNQNLNM